MTSFEEELTDLLDARAERIDVRHDRESLATDGPLLLETVGARPIGERREARGVRRDGRNWLLAAAAAIVLVVGVFGLVRSSSNPVTDVAAAGATDEYFASLFGADVDLVVWMDPEATQDQIDAVDEFLETSPLIESFPFIDRDQTSAEFRRYWADSPDVLAAVEPEQLPTSFRVSMTEGSDHLAEGITDELLALSGVQDVQQGELFVGDEEAVPVDSEAEERAEPLFLLPSDDVLTDGLEGFVSTLEDWTDEPDISGITVGRPTATGFDQLMVVALLDEREFSESQMQLIDGREVFVSTEGASGVAAELTDDGWWLHFYFNDVEAELGSLVRATTVVDGTVVFQSFNDIVELGRVSSLSPIGPTVAVIPGLDSNARRAFSVVPTREDIGLFVLAAEFEVIETVAVRGRTGHLAVSDDPNPGSMVAWFEPSGHMVYASVFGPGSAVDFAESLVVVDEATWRAAIPELPPLN